MVPVSVCERDQQNKTSIASLHHTSHYSFFFSSKHQNQTTVVTKKKKNLCPTATPTINTKKPKKQKNRKNTSDPTIFFSPLPTIFPNFIFSFFVSVLDSIQKIFKWILGFFLFGDDSGRFCLRWDWNPLVGSSLNTNCSTISALEKIKVGTWVFDLGNFLGLPFMCLILCVCDVVIMRRWEEKEQWWWWKWNWGKWICELLEELCFLNFGGSFLSGSWMRLDLVIMKRLHHHHRRRRQHHPGHRGARAGLCLVLMWHHRVKKPQLKRPRDWEWQWGNP